MADKLWELAKLDEAQLKMIREGEDTLDSVALVALQPVKVEVAHLNPSQIECLQGLEKKLGITLVAYEK